METMNDLSIYSCDDHLDLNSVPVDLWESRLPAALREQGPRVVDHNGAPTWVAEGRVFGPSGQPPTGKMSAIARTGVDDDGFRAGDPKRRLEDMDRDHIKASVIYGPSIFGLPLRDLELKEACYGAYNDFAVEFNAVDNARLCLLARLPGHHPEYAVSELTRCAAGGHRGAILEVFGADLADEGWARFWAVAEEAALPISFHIGGGTSKLRLGLTSWKAPAFGSVAPMQLDEPVSTMMFSGAFERHPGLKVVLAESGLGWLPYFLNRMDHEWEVWRDGGLDYTLRTPPSELFHRQVLTTFEDESVGPELIAQLGVDNVMWASDYPHPDSTFPNSTEAIARNLGHLDHDAVQHIVGFNCARLYRFSID
jgi:predicted TIM-barrel fold metal-dependent hydrolase